MTNTIEKKEIDLLEYWRIVQKRKGLLVTFAAVIVAFTAIRRAV